MYHYSTNGKLLKMSYAHHIIYNQTCRGNPINPCGHASIYASKTAQEMSYDM